MMFIRRGVTQGHIIGFMACFLLGIVLTEVLLSSLGGGDSSGAFSTRLIGLLPQASRSNAASRPTSSTPTPTPAPPAAEQPPPNNNNNNNQNDDPAEAEHSDYSDSYEDALDELRAALEPDKGPERKNARVDAVLEALKRQHGLPINTPPAGGGGSSNNKNNKGSQFLQPAAKPAKVRTACEEAFVQGEEELSNTCPTFYVPIESELEARWAAATLGLGALVRVVEGQDRPLGAFLQDELVSYNVARNTNPLLGTIICRCKDGLKFTEKDLKLIANEGLQKPDSL